MRKYVHIWALDNETSDESCLQKNKAFLAWEKLQNTEHCPLFLWNGQQHIPSTPTVTVIDIPAWCEEHMHILRNDLVSLVYDLGLASHKGTSVYAHVEDTKGQSFYWYTLLFEKHPKMFPHLYELCKLRALEVFLQQQTDYDTICLHAGDKKLAKALQQFATSQGRAFQHIRYARRPKFTRNMYNKIYAAFPVWCIGFARFVHWLWTVKRLLPKVPNHIYKKKSPHTVTMVSYAPPISCDAQGYVHSTYWQDLHILLREQQKQNKVHINWLFIRMHRSDVSLQSCLSVRKHMHTHAQSMYFAEELLSYTDICMIFMRYLYLGIRSLCLEKTLKTYARMPMEGNPHAITENMNYWPYLQCVWRESMLGWRGLERHILQKALEKYVHHVGRQEWTLFPLENCPWERMLIWALRKAQAGPVYGAQHSCVRPTDFRYFEDPRFYALAAAQQLLPHGILVNGAAAYDIFTFAKIPEQLLFAVEALRYQYLAHIPYLPQSTKYTHLVLIGSFFPDEVRAQLRVLQKWRTMESEAATWHIAVKEHPCLPLAPLLKEFSLQNTVHVLNQSMPQFFASIEQRAREGEGTVFWCANSTTVILELAHAGAAICVQGAENDFNLCPLDKTSSHCIENTVPTIYTAQQLQEFLWAPRRVSGKYAPFYIDAQLPRWKALQDIGAIVS